MSVASLQPDSPPAEGLSSNHNVTESVQRPQGPGPPLTIHQLAVTQARSRKLIKLSATICGQPAVCLVDSGASGNFVSTSFVTQHNLQAAVSSTQEAIKISLAEHHLPSALTVTKKISCCSR